MYIDRNVSELLVLLLPFALHSNSMDQGQKHEENTLSFHDSN